ncbi:MAG TPA: helix-turn-helix transcriptional regulator [Candidatus Eisenbergiella stercorigallinarum]|uniref:Helix-turn-helix transcriptional regulator n=1 Tax=Candidatus Eisenbergiella stercorigallinarum TaxID=2838557 RepID=A0A9D2QW12_9FIRM|nr:helix-turn-helix transcriptional regulator [Candidatus Eisenbergiella stercorigallinarum]
MKRNDILKKLMLQKNLCTADLARMTGIPYTTLKSIFDRGVEKSGYGSVCAICSALDITTDQLELLARESDGPEAHAAPDSEFFEMIRDFSEDEMALLKNYADYLRFLRNRK